MGNFVENINSGKCVLHPSSPASIIKGFHPRLSGVDATKKNITLKGVEWVNGLFLFPLVLGINVVATCK